MSAQAIAPTVRLLAGFGCPASGPASAVSNSAALPLQLQTDGWTFVTRPILKVADN
jgi:hypothetical protein